MKNPYMLYTMTNDDTDNLEELLHKYGVLLIESEQVGHHHRHSVTLFSNVDEPVCGTVSGDSLFNILNVIHGDVEVLMLEMAKTITEIEDGK